MAHKDGERLYQKALKTKNPEKELKLLEQAWELGCLKAAPSLGFYLTTRDEDMDDEPDDFREEAIRNNVRAYRMMKQAADGGVTGAVGALELLTSQVDLTDRKRYGALSGEDPRFLSHRYWEVRELLTGDRTAQYLYGLRLEETDPVAACWWLNRAAEDGSKERTGALKEIDKLKKSGEKLPPEARLILNFDLLSLVLPEEPESGGSDELREYCRNVPGQAPEEDCAVFREGLRAYYGKGVPVSYTKARECFRTLWKKGYKKLGPIIRELHVASADEREEALLQKLNGEASDKVGDDLRKLRERAEQDHDPHLLDLVDRYSDMTMTMLKNGPEYWKLQTALADEGDLFRMKLLIAHYSDELSGDGEMAEVWKKQLKVSSDRCFAQIDNDDMAACYIMASFYVHMLGAMNAAPEERRQTVDGAKTLLRRAVRLGSGPAQTLLDQLED